MATDSNTVGVRTNADSKRPLAGRRILVTRAREQAAGLVSLLEAAGAEALVFPCISIGEPESWEAADAAIAHLGDYDWVLFTSANGVTCFMARCAELDVDVCLAVSGHVAAVGPGTASTLAEYGIAASLVPEEYVGEGLLAALRLHGVGPGSRILLLRAQEAREVVPDGLRDEGALVDVAPVYRTVIGEGDRAVLERVCSEGVDAVTFTSPSTVYGFVALAGETVPILPPAACIGPIAAAAAREHGFSVVAEPAEHTVPALISALEEYFSD